MAGSSMDGYMTSKAVEAGIDSRTTRDFEEPIMAREQGHIGRAQARLERAIDVVGTALATHAQRIEPVLGPERPTEAQTTPDFPACSIVAAGMLRYAERLEGLAEFITATTERVDL